MNTCELQKIMEAGRAYFDSGRTLPIRNRMLALRQLRKVLKNHEQDIYRALQKDLGKSQTESYMCELGMVLSEITYMLSHLKKFARDQKAPTPLAQFAARSFCRPCPRGLVLIMSPWNYPLMLSLDPLVDAIAAGNTAVLKPSAYAPETARLLSKITAEAFAPGWVSVISGGREENQQLIHEKFDFIFFTGSPAVGKEVLQAAAPNLTPVALELGGKSPCIVDETANIPLAARRIVFGKFLNCGQTCVAPDYIVCHPSVYEALVENLKKEIERQFGAQPLNNPDYGKIISRKHFDRLTGLLQGSPCLYGGKTEEAQLRISPTLLGPCSWDEPVMQEEIFGPLLPILTYDSLQDLLQIINSRPHPLAFYFFSENQKVIDKVMTVCPFGGGCINDTIIHLATSQMGFGGIGNSGMGAYHGKVGFDTFSHRKSIVDKKTFLDLPMRYQPYRKSYDRLIRFFLR